MINTFSFDGGARLLRQTAPVARRIRDLAARARRADAPVVSVNDNVGRWRSDFRAVVAHCMRRDAPGRSVVRTIKPGYRLIAPADCVASERSQDTQVALAQMRRALGATTTPSRGVDFGSLANAKAA